MAIRTKVQVIPSNLVDKQRALLRLKQNGYVSLSDAAIIIYGNERFPTNSNNLSKIRIRLQKHHPSCIKTPSQTFINSYRKSHKGEHPECNYQITEKVINELTQLLK